MLTLYLRARVLVTFPTNYTKSIEDEFSLITVDEENSIRISKMENPAKGYKEWLEKETDLSPYVVDHFNKLAAFLREKKAEGWIVEWYLV